MSGGMSYIRRELVSLFFDSLCMPNIEGTKDNEKTYMVRDED